MRDEKLKRMCLRRWCLKSCRANCEKVHGAGCCHTSAHAVPSYDKLSGYLRIGLRSEALGSGIIVGTCEYVHGACIGGVLVWL